MIRVVALIATLTLAGTVLFHSSRDYRMLIGIVVSGAAVILAVRSFSAGKMAWGLAFMAVLGVFTPFHGSQFSPASISIFDLVALALFAVSPLVLGRPKALPASSPAPINWRWSNIPPARPNQRS